jgi:hypothetical protein
VQPASTSRAGAKRIASVLSGKIRTSNSGPRDSCEFAWGIEPSRVT